MKNRTYTLTGVSAAISVFLCWAFADHQFSGHWWESQAIADSNVFTYALLAAIIVAGLFQAQGLRAPVAPRRAPLVAALNAKSETYDPRQSW